MSEQKEAILQFVQQQKEKGRSVGEVLVELGIARSTYYRWRQGEQEVGPRGAPALTPEEEKKIQEVKAAHPEYRHRRIQGVLQQQGYYLSPSSIYTYLKGRGQVEPYARRAAPWKQPRYEVWQRNFLWGCDWTKLKVGHLRWYLLTLIDFFSRLIVAFEIVPTVNASHVKGLFAKGLAAQGIPLSAERKPELRVDQGSPNTSWVTQEFFEIIGAELSFARVRRPTDNAITERFYGSIKQEEIYLVGNYPDEISAKEEIGRYIRYYNSDRPHQALWNFTPASVHELNNKSLLLKQLEELKRAARERRKRYWLEQQSSCGRAERQPVWSSRDASEQEEHFAVIAENGKNQITNKNDSLNSLVLSHSKKT
jgi:putative transposase